LVVVVAMRQLTWIPFPRTRGKRMAKRTESVTG